MRLLLIGCAVIALASCQKPSQPAENETAAAAPEVPGKGVDRSHKGSAAPKVGFNDPDGNVTSLAAFAGKPTLVNLWASWCAPCVKELPTLDKLAKAEGGKLNVVAISQDDAPHASVEAFLKTHGIEALESYQDPKMRLSGALGAEVMPTSVLYDANGREIWRYIGDQDWTSAEAAKLVAESDAVPAG
ncbi:MAG TPA: TlpA disulfide reductase family protein [Sphingomicrobium sp.]|jgi:thiol-disulfide isomerase/thioredoxin